MGTRCAGWSRPLSIDWRCRDYSQVLTLTDEVLDHVRRYRQLRTLANEAGGQLFGTISGDAVLVSVATGPYAGDDRTRFGYRSSLRAAASAIKYQEANGLYYLGEWHTHAEGKPKPSREDATTMSGILKKSTLGATAAMLLIVGTAPAPAGLYVGTFAKGLVCNWKADMEKNKRWRIARWIAGILH
jgi:integrative and conjugative element protein (TIGR02256 family)